MKVIVVYNATTNGVLQRFGMQNREVYNTHTVPCVVDALQESGHNVGIVDADKDLVPKLSAESCTALRHNEQFLVFNMAYGIQGECRLAHVPAILEMLGLPYTGSSPIGHALALDKVVTKQLMRVNGLPTPDYFVVESLQERMPAVTFPVLVKPKMESISLGLRVIHRPNELRDAVVHVLEEFHQPALVEQFIPGREFTVGIVGNKNPEVFPVLEIELEGDPFAVHSFDDKMSVPRQKHCPAQIPAAQAQTMQDLSLRAFNTVQMRDAARVDMRTDADRKIFLLEVNSMASLNPQASFVQAARACGYDYTHLINRIVDVAVARYGK